MIRAPYKRDGVQGAEDGQQSPVDLANQLLLLDAIGTISVGVIGCWCIKLLVADCARLVFVIATAVRHVLLAPVRE